MMMMMMVVGPLLSVFVSGTPVKILGFGSTLLQSRMQYSGANSRPDLGYDGDALFGGFTANSQQQRCDGSSLLYCTA